MVDLRFMDPKIKDRKFNCSKCPKKKQMLTRCHDDDFNNLRTKVHQQKYGSTDRAGMVFSFCPAKAMRYDYIADLFEQCRMSYSVGEFPEPGGLREQDAVFAEAYPTFVDRWDERKYQRVWDDIADVIPKCLEALAKLIGARGI